MKAVRTRLYNSQISKKKVSGFDKSGHFFLMFIHTYKVL